MVGGSRFAGFVGLVVAMASVGACASEPSGKAQEDIAKVESEIKLNGTQDLGTIASGQTVTAKYTGTPRYLSYAFEAKGGDAIVVDVKSREGDAVAFLTDPELEVLALNDDAATGTFDARVTYAVPADVVSASYRLVLREYDTRAVTFAVSLSITSSRPTSCTYEGNVVAIGATFPAVDGCNTCTCSADGAVACTGNSCVCDPANEPHRSYIGTPEQCQTIRYTCDDGQVPFQNNCGCGCEPTPR